MLSKDNTHSKCVAVMMSPQEGRAFRAEARKLGRSLNTHARMLMGLPPSPSFAEDLPGIVSEPAPTP
jgi:hypothetical protein